MEMFESMDLTKHSFLRNVTSQIGIWEVEIKFEITTPSQIGFWDVELFLEFS